MQCYWKGYWVNDSTVVYLYISIFVVQIAHSCLLISLEIVRGHCTGPVPREEKIMVLLEFKLHSGDDPSRKLLNFLQCHSMQSGHCEYTVYLAHSANLTKLDGKLPRVNYSTAGRRIDLCFALVPFYLYRNQSHKRSFFNGSPRNFHTNFAWGTGR